MNTAFNTWLDTLLEEKEIDGEQILEAKSPNGTPNSIPVAVVAAAMKSAPAHEQAAIKTTLVKIDYRNGDILHFFRHLAGALAVNL
jgi:hypothetical protein